MAKHNMDALSEKIIQYRELVLSNLVMLAEIPPSAGDVNSLKSEYIAERLNDFNLAEVSSDEEKNLVAVLPGKSDGKANSKHIALVAHMDTLHTESLDYTVRIETNVAVGQGLVDNNLGLATIMSLPYLLQELKIELESTIVLCFSANSLGEGNLKGTRFFVENFSNKIDYGICVEGYPLGRISYNSLGTMRKKISISIPEEYDWTRFGTANAIINLNNLMNAILEIPIPSRPKTSIIFNSIKAGEPYSGVAQKSSLILDIRSESNEIVRELDKKIDGLAKEHSSRSGAHISSHLISQRNLGGLDFMHPMVQSLVDILDELKVTHRMTPSASDLSAFIDNNIPAITLGLTNCEHYNTENEIMYIKPMYKGIAQLLAFLKEADNGFEKDISEAHAEVKNG